MSTENNTNNNNNNRSLATIAIDAVSSLWQPDQIEIIRKHLSPNISTSELGLFAIICQRTGLDPFQRQIYAIKRGDRMTVQTGIDGYRLIAARTGDLAGIDDATFDTEDEEHPNRATVTVYRFVRGARVAFSASARWREYVQINKKDGSTTDMWQRMPYLMLGKCAEALALRKAFPAELSGLYTNEEMAQASADEPPGVVVESSQERQPAAPATSATARSEKFEQRPYNPLADTTLRQRLNALGMRVVADVQAFVDEAVRREPEASVKAACYAYLTALETPEVDEPIPYTVEAQP